MCDDGGVDEFDVDRFDNVWQTHALLTEPAAHRASVSGVSGRAGTVSLAVSNFGDRHIERRRKSLVNVDYDAVCAGRMMKQPAHPSGAVNSTLMSTGSWNDRILERQDRKSDIGQIGHLAVLDASGAEVAISVLADILAVRGGRKQAVPLSCESGALHPH